MPTLADAERAHIIRVLEAVGWNKKEAARVLDISRGTLYRKIVDYGLDPDPARHVPDLHTNPEASPPTAIAACPMCRS